MYLHLYLYARKVAGASSSKKLKKITIPLKSPKAIIGNTRKLIAKLRSPSGDTEWSVYYDNMLNYSDEALKHKSSLAARFLDEGKCVYD